MIEITFNSNTIMERGETLLLICTNKGYVAFKVKPDGSRELLDLHANIEEDE